MYVIERRIDGVLKITVTKTPGMPIHDALAKIASEVTEAPHMISYLIDNKTDLLAVLERHW